MANTNPRRSVAKKATARPVRKLVLPKQTTDDLSETESFDDEPEVPEVLKDLAKEAMKAHVEIEKPKRLSNEDIAEAEDRTTEDFYVEEWDGTVLLRSLSARAIGMFMDDDSEEGGIQVNEDGGVKLQLKSMQQNVIQSGVIDPVITDDAYEMWMEKGIAPVMKIFKKIMEISKISGKNTDGTNVAVEEEKAKFRKTE